MTDNDLMEAVRDGQVEKLAVLFERHHIPLYNFFLRLTGNRAASEDLVQDVFIRILKYRATYLGDDKFAVWMYKIARNAHFDHLRKRRDRDTVPIEDHMPVLAAPANEDPAERAERGAEAALIAKAMSSLSPKKQEILILSRFQNLKYREIAELLDCPVGTVKGLVHRAVAELGDVYGRLTKEACRHEV